MSSCRLGIYNILGPFKSVGDCFGNILVSFRYLMQLNDCLIVIIDSIRLNTISLTFDYEEYYIPPLPYFLTFVMYLHVNASIQNHCERYPEMLPLYACTHAYIRGVDSRKK